jgi:hypothetical protein
LNSIFGKAPKLNGSYESREAQRMRNNLTVDVPNITNMDESFDDHQKVTGSKFETSIFSPPNVITFNTFNMMGNVGLPRTSLSSLSKNTP